MTGAYEIRTVDVEEINLFYSADKTVDTEIGCIGHLRADFGHRGEEFWTTWWDHCEELKTQVFKDELDTVINHLREKGNMLHSLKELSRYCYKRPEAKIDTKYRDDTYGFKINTEAHSYYLRGILTQGDYNLYAYCYRRDMLENCLAAAHNEQHHDTEE